ncbi:MAG: hypothetical protein IT377_08960 [Polyangiaceae bacterium]|nr:hypothetical protein [Polyangiaceae bacterium]
MSERKVVLRGSIRVDARRARAKLREHLLVDLRTYSLELARAAVALGATSMNLSWDADDVRFAFDGPCLSPERLARLLDFALSDAGDEHAAPLRCLALGVNAALGLGVRSVTVTGTDGSRGWAVEFTPDTLSDETEEIRAVSCNVPEGAFPRGTHVHVRRKLGLAVLRRAVSSETPPEVSVLVEHTRRAPLALSCGGVPVVRAPAPPVLLRVPFTLPQARHAAVEIALSSAPSGVELMERGVRLLAYSWAPLAGLGNTTDTVIPARVVVDGDELPTNASRSALREDTPLARELSPAAVAAFRRALAALVARHTGAALPDDVEVVTDDASAWRTALGAMACSCVAALRAGAELDPDVRALLDVPMFDAASGGRLSVGAVVSSPVVPVWKHDEPLPPDLAPWLSHVVWLRGHVVERILGGSNVEDATKLVKRAREGAARRARFLSHAPSQPVVAGNDAVLARERFALTTGPTQGLSGEVALLAPVLGGAPRPSFLRVYVEERPLEVIAVEPAFCPLAFDAAVTWPGHLRPRFDYDGIERDARLSQALHAVSMVAIGIANRAAERLKQLELPERAVLERVLCDAVAAWSVVPAKLGLLAPGPGFFRRDLRKLFRAEIIPLHTGERTNLHTLAAYVDEKKALCVVPTVPDGPRHPAPDGRPVVVATAHEAEAIAATLGHALTRVPYVRGVSDDGARAGSIEGRRAALARTVAEERARQGLAPLSAQLWFDRDGAQVLVAPAITATDIESHRGIVLSWAKSQRSQSGLIVATDDPRSVPNPDWNGLIWKPKRYRAWFEQRFLDQALAALEGDAQAATDLGLISGITQDDLGLSLCVLAQVALLRSSSNPTAAATEILRRLEGLLVLCSLDELGIPARESIAGMRQRHGERFPVLDAVPGFATGDWRPLVVRHERERELVVRLFPGSTSSSLELVARRARSLLESEKRAVLARPATDIRDFGGASGAGDVAIHVPPDESGLEVAVALPARDLPPGAPWVSLRFEGRHVHGLNPSELGLPVVANVSSSQIDHFVSFGPPSPDGLARFGASIREAAVTLLGTLAAERALLSDPRALALCLSLCDLGFTERVREIATSADLRFPTVQGGESALGQLTLRDGKLLHGSARFSPWLTREGRPSELDQPILFLPPGDLGAQIAALFARLGTTLSDVSGALLLLQQRRGGSSVAAPKLDGVPVHPILRRGTWELGVAAGEGEIELVAGTESRVRVLLLDGRSETLEVALPCALDVVVRVDAIDLAAVRSRLISDLEGATLRVLVEAAPHLHELPAFVRQSARRLLCLRPVACEAAALSAAPVFEDTGGTFHTYAALATQKRWLFTSLAPPYPVIKKLTLRLALDEAEALASSFEVVKVDAQIERALRAEQRKLAPQVPAVLLASEQRAGCLVTAPVNVEGTTGEVGVLLPPRASLAGGKLFVTRRPLCAIECDAGWPLVMALNDDSVEADRYFEGPADRGVLPVLAGRARAAARAALERAFSPSYALCSRWIDEVVIRGFRVTGCLWLGGTFPQAPKVRVYAGEQAAPMVRCLEARGEKGALGRALPLEGDLLVRWTGEGAEGGEAIAAEVASTLATLASLSQTWDALNELGEQVAVELVRQARAQGLDAPVLDEHALSLSLLGFDVPAPAVVAADGAPLAPAAVRAELDRTGTVWLSDGRGSSEGAFPGVAPSFFVPEGSPLARVLAARAPEGAMRRLGGAASHLAPPDTTALPPPTPVLVPPDPADLPATDTWWERLTGALHSSLAGEPLADASRAEHRALLALIVDLRLTGSPVERLVLQRGKRPLRYDNTDKQLVLSLTDPTAAALLGRPDDRGALCVLAAHALAEVNRSLEGVTDAEERRGLVALLEEL